MVSINLFQNISYISIQDQRLSFLDTMVHILFIQKVELAKEGINAISWEIQFNILTKHDCFFVPEEEISFDEHGTSSKSNYNPVRQYNDNKPNKHRIDFFILDNLSGGHSFIHHIDVCKKKQERYFNSFRFLESQAVVNTLFQPDCIKIKMDKYMDNWYSEPELFIMLKTKPRYWLVVQYVQIGKGGIQQR